ncbi:Na+/H+ antiporter subunit D [Peteryoungia ipomoeae]|uniref:Na+/H+ antiporter subunit D n=1 Tax=Peteryoungia ipomoeae TaxID=1210932 RepID=A0A4S8P138_9HYPH|nr:Na+/H+ antiporter subunit D [Peteryoungia ipomoeae]THV22945.1 Na+/H+ antiporter subunit D [Peteryoungia ipomoeae]
MAAPSTQVVDYAAAMVTEPASFAQWLTVTPIALCMAFAAFLMMIRHRVHWHPPVAILGLLLLVLNTILLLRQVLADGPITMMMGRWLPPFGIAITVDLTGALLALSAAIVALACVLYAQVEIDRSGRRYGFYPLLMMLMAGVCGAFLTGDIFNLYVWFEVLLISSFGLLILGSEHRQIDGALKYAVLNLIATTLFLIAVAYLYGIFGTLNMADIARKVPLYQETAPLVTLSALFILAFSMKAAAFPVNFWLPASYHTPRVVVSALFAGLLTKVGVYALMRVMVMLFPVERETLSLPIAVVAVLTLIFGALGALAQSDVRRFLGFVVIAGIGNMFVGVAIGGEAAVGAALLYALHSIILMTALYLVAGEIARIGGSFNLASVSGLWTAAPVFGAVSLALFFAASGLPPFSGFWPKALLVKASIDIGAWWLAAAVLISGFFTTIAFGRVFLFAFWKPAPADRPVSAGPIRPGETGWRLTPIVLLGGLVVWFGLFPEQLISATHDAAIGLSSPVAYIGSVFTQGGAQ